MRGALGRGASGPALLFIPGAEDDKRFGFVAIAVGGEPKDDMPGKWSHYPAAMLSPPLAVLPRQPPVV